MTKIKELRDAIIEGKNGTVKDIIDRKLVGIEEDLSQGKTFISSLIPSIKALYSSERDNIGYRPMHWAARVGNMEALSYLIEKKANINCLNFIGNTPLHIALYYGQSAAVALLVENGATLNIHNTGSTSLNINESFSTLHYALLYGTKADISLLLSKNSNVKARGVDNVSSLHLCMHRNELEVLEALLDKGADVAAVDKSGLTAFDYGLTDDAVGLKLLECLLRKRNFAPHIKALESLVGSTNEEHLLLRAHKVLLLVAYQVPLPSDSTLGILDLMLSQKNYALINMLMSEMVQNTLNNKQSLFAQIGLTYNQAQAPAHTTTTVTDLRLVETLFKPAAETVDNKIATVVASAANNSSSSTLPPPAPPLPRPPTIKPTILVIKAPPSAEKPKAPTTQVGFNIADILKSNPRFNRIIAANKGEVRDRESNADDFDDDSSSRQQTMGTKA